MLNGKYQGETIKETFNFLSRLSIGETILTQVVTATTYSGIDATPAAIISGVASGSGSIVTQAITAGVVGVIYTLMCTITTSLGQTLQLSAFLTVQPNSV